MTGMQRKALWVTLVVTLVPFEREKPIASPLLHTAWAQEEAPNLASQSKALTKVYQDLSRELKADLDHPRPMGVYTYKPQAQFRISSSMTAFRDDGSEVVTFQYRDGAEAAKAMEADWKPTLPTPSQIKVGGHDAYFGVYEKLKGGLGGGAVVDWQCGNLVTEVIVRFTFDRPPFGKTIEERLKARDAGWDEQVRLAREQVVRQAQQVNDRLEAAQVCQGDTLRQVVKRYLPLGGKQFAGVAGDATEQEQMVLDLQTIVLASDKQAKRLADVLVSFLTDAQENKNVYPLLVAGDRVIVTNLEKHLGKNEKILRYCRAKDRWRQREDEKTIHDVAFARDFVLLALDVGATLAGLPAPGALMSQADFVRELQDPKWGLQQKFSNLVNMATSAPDVPVEIGTGWTFLSFWLKQKDNLPAKLPQLDRDLLAQINAAPHEGAWLDRMDEARKQLSHELWLLSNLRDRVDKHIKEKGWNPNPDFWANDEHQLYVEAGREIDSQMKLLIGQILALAYWAGWDDPASAKHDALQGTLRLPDRPGISRPLILTASASLALQAPVEQPLTIKHVKYWSDLGLADSWVRDRLALVSPSPQFTAEDMAWLRGTGVSPGVIEGAQQYARSGLLATALVLLGRWWWIAGGVALFGFVARWLRKRRGTRRDQVRSQRPDDGLVLHVNGRTYSLCEGVRLAATDIPGLAAPWGNAHLAEVSPHPTDSSILGLKNLSSAPWTATLAGGEQRTVEPGRSLRLAAGTRVHFGTAEATIMVGPEGNGYRLEAGGRSLELTTGRTLTASDLADTAHDTVAQVVHNPQTPEVLGLKNLSAMPWKATVDGVDRDVVPGQTVRLKAGVSLSFGVTNGTVLSR
jgi:hypothetical protein